MKRIAIAVSLMLTLSTAANDLTGTVVDADAKPIDGAYVYVYAAFPRIGPSTICPSCYRDCGKLDRVDANGAFHISGLDPSLVFDVLAVAEGYEPEFARKTDPARGPVTIALKPRLAHARWHLRVRTGAGDSRHPHRPLEDVHLAAIDVVRRGGSDDRHPGGGRLHRCNGGTGAVAGGFV